MPITAARRIELAAELGLSAAYLYQCLTARKAMKPEEAVRIEQESRRELMRWDLRPNDWHRIWPELVDLPGRPDIPGAVSATGPGPATEPAKEGA